ncbi:hypothetical protein PAPHI01_2332 [Pancytospora philotis]|nr:hypothetical protein PAPHI01_2332 [Pancytospora philotis]
MKYFLLKKPMGLAFVQQEYVPEEPVQQCTQVRAMAGRSNSRLVKCRDGCWYIRTGSSMLKLKPVPARDISVISITSDGGEFVGRVASKWFLEKKQG